MIDSEGKLVAATMANLPAKLWRFEPGTPVGMPDIHWVSDSLHLSKTAGWLELKYEEEIVRPQQAIFLREYVKAGGRAGVFSVYQGRFWYVSGRHLSLDRKIDYTMASACWSSEATMNWGHLLVIAASGT